MVRAVSDDKSEMGELVKRIEELEAEKESIRATLWKYKKHPPRGERNDMMEIFTGFWKIVVDFFSTLFFEMAHKALFHQLITI